MKDILSVFDFSGNWPVFFADAGHNVMCLDLKHDPDAHDAIKFSVAHFFEELGIENVDGVILAPPCTDFCNSGAQYWPAKDRDGRTATSVELVRQGLRCVEFWKPDWWVLENPVGRLPKLVPELGRPRLIFNPCDYAGWVELTDEERARQEELRGYYAAGREFSRSDLELVKKSNAYTKRTCLWGEFKLPEERCVEPVRVCAQGSWLQRLGGKSDKTKEARSDTPLGFARAFAVANDWSEVNAREYDLRRMIEWARELKFPDVDRAADEVEAEFGWDRVARAEFVAAFAEEEELLAA
jgi:hypothetical protein